MKLKHILLSLILLSMTCSCVYYDESRRRTHPGYVAFDYTYNALEKYAAMLEYVYRFNEYYSQERRNDGQKINETPAVTIGSMILSM